MKIRLQKGKGRIITLLIIFVVVLGIVGVLLQSKMRTLLQNYIEKQITEQARGLAELAEERFELELLNLEMIAGRLQAKEEADIQQLDTFIRGEENASAGVLSLNGTAIVGEALEFSDYDGIQESFRGNNGISYKKGKGLLFTVPVYNGGNVKYVLYRFYEEAVLLEKFEMQYYDGQGKVIIATRGEELVVPYEGWSNEDVSFIRSATVQHTIEEVKEKLNISTVASVYCKEEKQYLFIAEIGDFDFILVGYIEDNVVSEGLTYIVALILWVFGLLLLLLAIGMVFLFGAEEKARESDELRKAKLMADTANRAKSDFLANMSHEIRTPINAVMGMNEMVLRECESESIKEYALNIQSASNTLLSIINDILDFSKIEAGKMEIINGNYYLGSVLNDVVNMIQIKANQKKLSFSVQIDETIPDQLWGDSVRIRQIMVNILNNAVKYTKEGSVTFRISQEQLQPEEIVLRMDVIDTGIGIKKENMEKLFRDFERLDMKENRNIEGTGLGLAITRQLVELMQGRMEVSSVYGKGSTFTVFLPQRVISQECIGNFEKKFQTYIQTSSQYKESFVAPNARILVVDDNEMNLFVVQNLLKQTQVQITCCTSGRECLEHVKKERYDVILLDHMMPELDGVETLKCMKELEDYPCQDTPVIALTANAILGVREIYLAEGFDDYMSKPIDGAALEKLLRKYISNETEPLLNRTIGLKYSSGIEEMYREFLKMFCEMKEEKLQNIESAFATQDWKNYTIYVHALKSTALSIGGQKLSDLAKQLELAGKEDRISYILEHHKELVALYEETAKACIHYLES